MNLVYESKEAPSSVAFRSGFRPMNQLQYFDQTTIKNETMIFSGDYEFCRKNGGPITNAFLDLLPPDWPKMPFLLDSRVHMLKPSWMPCIGGWHLDDIPRGGPENQPDFTKVDPLTGHVAAVIGDASLTEFALGQIHLDLPREGMVYKSFDEQLQRLKPVSKFVTSGRLFSFGSEDLHRGTPATKDGFRMFIRASVYSPRKPANEVRHQTQVYVESFSEGW